MSDIFSDSSSGAPETSDAGGYQGASDDFLSGLGDAFVSSVESTELGEDGSIDMRVLGADSEPAAPESADSPSSADTSEQPASGEPSVDASFLEGQYKEVQGWATRVSQENAELKAQLVELAHRMDQGSPSSAEEAGPEFDLDPEVQSQLDSYMEKNLETAMSHKLGISVDELGPLLQEVKYNAEIRAAYSKYDDFEDHIPVMTDLSHKFPNLTADELYNLATTFGSPASAPEGQPAPVAAPETPAPQGTTRSEAPSPPQPSHADAAQRAQQVQTLTSVSNDEGFTPERSIKTPMDAALKALEDME
jgi:hypothetical protein